MKGRDWYDFVWYCANHPQLHLAHLEKRMRQSGHWAEDAPLEAEPFLKLISQAIEQLDIDQAKSDVLPFVREPASLDVWSQDFFRDIVNRMRFV